MKGQKIKELIPIGLIVIALIYTAITVLTTDIILTHQHWIAYGLTSLVLVTLFINKKISNIILGLTLILGLLNVLAFTPTILTIGGGLTFNALDAEIMIGIQLFSLIVFLTFIYAYRRDFAAWINKDGL
ncbi:hypothetical protein WBG78_23220 [Chryseolinea sp. T2]|uniref:hypothetical protein n=1 Tax=Chryseolinea sp. T2 TaxID=3129255 RepID=UPI00307835EA